MWNAHWYRPQNDRWSAAYQGMLQGPAGGRDRRDNYGPRADPRRPRDPEYIPESRRLRNGPTAEPLRRTGYQLPTHDRGGRSSARDERPFPFNSSYNQENSPRRSNRDYNNPSTQRHRDSGHYPQPASRRSCHRPTSSSYY